MFYKVLKSFLFNKYLPRSPDICVSNQITYVKLLFNGKISFNCKDKLQKVLNNAFPSVEFRYLLTNDFRIGNYFFFKF